jgi:hypothetical protein
MLELYRAEWKKVFSNIKLTGFLVWIFPVGYFAFYSVMIILSLFSDSIHAGLNTFGSGSWVQDSLNTWNMLIFFPGNLFARMLPLAFMAVVIAGEYQWRTWKNIIPRNRRWKLMIAKMAALLTLVLLSFLVTALVASLGPSTGQRIHGLGYGPVLTLDVAGQFILDTLRTGLIALLSLAILVGYAAIAAVLTRSILGGLLAGFAFSILDATSLGMLLFLSNMFESPDLLNLFQLTPTYNLGNLHTWLFDGHAQRTIADGIPFLTAEPTFWVSLLILSIWIVLLTGLPIWFFDRQEINE